MAKQGHTVSPDTVTGAPSDAVGTQRSRLDPVTVGAWADAIDPTAAMGNDPARAKVEVGGKTFALQSNELGNFQRVYVPPLATARVEVEFLEGAEGDPVILRVVDGGTLNGSGLTGKAVLDAEGKAVFEIKVTENLGTHRVVVSRGSEVKTVDLWVGSPLPVREAK